MKRLFLHNDERSRIVYDRYIGKIRKRKNGSIFIKKVKVFSPISKTYNTEKVRLQVVGQSNKEIIVKIIGLATKQTEGVE